MNKEIMEGNKMKLGYFGTDLTTHGHYFWNLSGESIYNSNLDFHKVPFNPEQIHPEKDKKGDVGFYQVGGYTVLVIVGSCVDKRPNSKSVFYVKATIDKKQMQELIMSVPIAKKIIDKMPFEITWYNTTKT